MQHTAKAPDHQVSHTPVVRSIASHVASWGKVREAWHCGGQAGPPSPLCGGGGGMGGGAG